MTRYLAVNSGQRYHLEIGGGGDAILLLHGFSGDHRIWKRLTSRLRADYQTIALDLLGHGASDAPAERARYSMAAVAADIINLLDQLDCDCCHLLGYSMGGRLALYLALRHPRRFQSLVLESASAGLASAKERAARRRRDNELAAQIEARGIDWFVSHWEDLPLWASQKRLPPTVLRTQREQRRRNRPIGLANSLRGLGSGTQPSLWQELARLRLPVQLIVGEDDDKFRRINQSMLERLTRARLALLPAAGHNTHLEAPAAFEELLLSFLERV